MEWSLQFTGNPYVRRILVSLEVFKTDQAHITRELTAIQRRQTVLNQDWAPNRNSSPRPSTRPSSPPAPNHNSTPSSKTKPSQPTTAHRHPQTAASARQPHRQTSQPPTLREPRRQGVAKSRQVKKPTSRPLPTQSNTLEQRQKTPKPIKTKQKPAPWGRHDTGLSVDSMVGVKGLKPSTSRSQTARAINCATPR